MITRKKTVFGLFGHSVPTSGKKFPSRGTFYDFFYAQKGRERRRCSRCTGGCKGALDFWNGWGFPPHVETSVGGRLRTFQEWKIEQKQEKTRESRLPKNRRPSKKSPRPFGSPTPTPSLDANPEAKGNSFLPRGKGRRGRWWSGQEAERTVCRRENFSTCPQQTPKGEEMVELESSSF
ncbi:hypothetical protein GWK47_014418 [Chionoecetes opilio]|uniref:Uncharacterized protein n=1 Tax=Chionoecetes opilio TaxID=41210 RepID=A0A8J4XVY6_CHIOP|nr:hypothetical protein GWK47_014418 [Chionoecetes opilio]